MMTYKELCRKQVAWYRKHGRYPEERIVKDARGIEFVIGDAVWNGTTEFIEGVFNPGKYMQTMPTFTEEAEDGTKK